MSQAPIEMIELGACPTYGGPAQFIDPDRLRAAELSTLCVEDIKYLLDVGHFGEAHYAGCDVVRGGTRCTCRLGLLRRRYQHWPENGKPDTDEEWARHRGEI